MVAIQSTKLIMGLIHLLYGIIFLLSHQQGRKLVRSPPKNRGILQRNTEFSEDITNTVLSSCDGNSLSDSLHDMDLVGGFPNLKIEEVTIF